MKIDPNSDRDYTGKEYYFSFPVDPETTDKFDYTKNKKRNKSNKPQRIKPEWKR